MTGFPGQRSPRRCVVLFARPSRHEARLKRVHAAAPLFEYTRRRVEAAVHALPDVDLLLCSDDPSCRLPQRGADFGERLRNAFTGARALGYEQIVAVGADAPGLGLRQISAAFQSLETHDVVLGRACDGGAYLIGTRGDIAALMRGIPWQTSAACEKLAANASSLAFLDECLVDIDSGLDLEALGDDPSLEAEARLLLRQLLSSHLNRPAFRHTPPPSRRNTHRLELRGPPVRSLTAAVD